MGMVMNDNLGSKMTTTSKSKDSGNSVVKKNRKKNKKTAAQVEEKKTLELENNPYLVIFNKKIRSLRKKNEKNKSLEQQQQAGKVLNEQQLEVLSKKDSVEKMLAEYEALKLQFTELIIKEEEEKSETSSTKSVEPEVEEEEQQEIPISTEDKSTTTVVPEDDKKSIETNTDIKAEDSMFQVVADLLALFHSISYCQSHNVEVPMVLDYFVKVLCGSTRPWAEVTSFTTNLHESVNEALLYLNKNDSKSIITNVTYAQLHELVQGMTVAPSSIEEVAESLPKQPLEDGVLENSRGTEEKLKKDVQEFNFFTESTIENEQESIVTTEEDDIDFVLIEDCTKISVEHQHVESHVHRHNDIITAESLATQVQEESTEIHSITNNSVFISEKKPQNNTPMSFAAALSNSTTTANTASTLPAPSSKNNSANNNSKKKSKNYSNRNNNNRRGGNNATSSESKSIPKSKPNRRYNKKSPTNATSTNAAPSKA